MIQPLLQVVAPVFVIILSGYGSVKSGILTDNEIAGILKFSQKVALPIFLFLSMLKLDLLSVFNFQLLLSYYSGALMCFTFGMIWAKKFLHCSISESTVIGFTILFSNAVLLGLPITTLAYSEDSIGSNLAIISVNAPLCYLIGISIMEWTNNDTKSFKKASFSILKLILSNNITMGLLLGLICNLLGVQIFSPFYKGLELISAGAISTALFSLGGLLVAYNISKHFDKILLIIVFSLFFHPFLTFIIAKFIFHIPKEALQGAIITAGMGPGINTFIFASIYQKEMEVVAGAILVSTPLSIFATLFWMGII